MKNPSRIPIEHIDEVRSWLPPVIATMLTEHGVASALDGFLWTVEPTEYAAWLKKVYYRCEEH